MTEPISPASLSSPFKKQISSVMRIPRAIVAGQSAQVWRDRLNRVASPKGLISTFLVASALYCFVIGRDRYTATSEFVIQTAAPFETASASVLAGAAAAPQAIIDPAGNSGATAESGSLAIDVCAKTFTAKLA